MQRLILASLAIVLPLLVIVAIGFDTHGPFGSEQKLHLVTQIVGAYCAAISALAILILALLGSPISRMLPLVVAFLAGLLIFQVHWSTAIALAAICIAAVARETITAVRTASVPTDLHP